MGEEAGAAASPPLSMPGTPIEVDLSARDCDGSAVILLVPPQQVDPYLPPGFHVRDPQDLLVQLPAATGQAAAFIATLVCRDQPANADEPREVGFAAILVERPNVADLPPTRGYDVYGVDIIVPPLLGETMAGAGWPARVGDLSSSATRLPTGGAVVEAGATVNGVADYSYQLALAAPIPQGVPQVNFTEFTVRVWSDHGAGVAFVEYTFSGDVPVGTAVCDFPPGSPAAQLTDSQFCTPDLDRNPGGHVAATGLGVELMGRFAHYPGVHAR